MWCDLKLLNTRFLVLQLQGHFLWKKNAMLQILNGWRGSYTWRNIRSVTTSFWSLKSECACCTCVYLHLWLLITRGRWSKLVCLSSCALLVWLALWIRQFDRGQSDNEILFFHGEVTAFVNLILIFVLLAYPMIPCQNPFHHPKFCLSWAYNFVVAVEAFKLIVEVFQMDSPCVTLQRVKLVARKA